jgi:UDP-GlcNAc:undecaprenyl-phosphate GlcNAc-1-phosphate transferase
MTQIIVTALTGFVTSVALVAVCRRAAHQFGYTAKPRADRWHERPTALLGGVGIAVTVLALHLLLIGPETLPVLLAGTGMIFLLGLVDDLANLKPYAKLVGEIAVASLFVFFGYRLGWTTSLTLDTLVTMVWIVGLTNALNLLDNMDGLCAGISLIAGSALLATFLLNSGVTAEAIHLALLLGAIAGFLVYNFHPASIFMGDSGSLFLGLNLAVLTLGSPNGTHGTTNMLSIVAAPLLVLLVPIFDTTLVTVSRILSGRSAAQGGRDHSSHRLVAIGLSERRAVAVLWALAGLGGMLSVSIYRVQNGWSSIAAAVFALAMIIFFVYLAHVRVYVDADDSRLRTGRITPFVAEFMHKRRIAEVILDVCLVAIAYYSAYRVRFGAAEYPAMFPALLQSLPLVVGVQMVTLFVVGAYRGVWRYFGLIDGVTFARGVLFGTLTSVFLIVYLYRFESYSRGVFIIYAAFLLLMLVGSRASFRLISEFANRRRTDGPRLVIYGAGESALVAVRELLNQPERYRMLGFVDDDPGKHQQRVQGYPVLGSYNSLVSLVRGGAVDDIVISTRLMDAVRLRELEDLCQEHQVRLSRLDVNLKPLVAVS